MGSARFCRLGAARLEMYTISGFRKVNSMAIPPVPLEKWEHFYSKAKEDGFLIEQVIEKIYTSHLAHDAVAIDGGANVGHHSLGLARHLNRGSVVAVEANLDTYGALCRNCQGYDNVNSIYAALQESPGLAFVEFSRSSSHPGRSGVNRLWELLAPGEVKYEAPEYVPATTIDQIVDKSSLSRLDFVKLDLEGGEYAALRGGSESLKRFRPLVVTEHSHLAPSLNGFDLNEYFSWVASIGYVFVSPSGEVVDISNPFPFWYVFLVPSESLDRWSLSISDSLLGFI
jgi:FkbM family methyltransferase